jgi:hypothetical protein
VAEITPTNPSLPVSRSVATVVMVLER